jgi:hypothetical protein
MHLTQIPFDTALPSHPDCPCCWMQATLEMDAAGTVTSRWRVDATEALPAPLADPGLMKCASDTAWVQALVPRP